MIENSKKLLNEVMDIIKKHDTIARATGANFNVFECLNITTNELDICRVLHALLNPQGAHGQGAIFLEAFFDTALKDININKSELAAALVSREHSIQNQRRIDIYIETQSWAIPIEVKIFAPDQKSQCVDYQEYAILQNKNYRLYYLTPTAREPSEDSTRRGDILIENDSLTNITFAEDILKWLDICVSRLALTLAPIREILLQFMSTIRRFCGKLEDNIMNDIIKTLVSSPENMESAVNIAASLEECNREIIRKLFLEIDNRVPAQKLSNEYDWEYSGKGAKCSLDSFQKKKKNVCPGISYHLKDFNSGGKNVSVWVRCEVEYYGFLIVGLCVNADGEKCNNKPAVFNPNDLIKHGIQEPKECTHENFTKEWEYSDWWLYWDFVYAQSGEKIDFRDANTAEYFSLFDTKGFDCVVENCVKAINTFLSRK